MGVGRSGTSALTRVLNLLGAALPPETLGVNRGNERGHWEPLSILALNEEILSQHASDWFDVRSFPKAWFTSSEAEPFIERATAIVEDEYDGAALIVIKEPRICRLAPIYLAALDRAGYASRVVIPLRHPSEVAGSLQLRDGTDELISELIWIRHVLETEAATRQCPRVWTTYDQLLRDWWSVQATIASGFDLPWPKSPWAMAPEINAFLAPALRHFDAGKAPPHRELGPVSSRIWQAAQAGLTGDEATLRVGFDEIRVIVDEIDRLGASQLTKERADKIASEKRGETTARAAATAMAAREAAETALATERRAREAVETALTNERQVREVAQTAATIERQAREAAEADAAIANRQACDAQAQMAKDAVEAAAHVQKLEAESADKSQRITDLYASSSWRLTGPLRSAARLLRARSTQ